VSRGDHTNWYVSGDGTKVVSSEYQPNNEAIVKAYCPIRQTVQQTFRSTGSTQSDQVTFESHTKKDHTDNEVECAATKRQWRLTVY
jgi:hypothetical protein